MQVWKFSLSVSDNEQIIMAPGWLNVVGFGLQDDRLTMWGEVHPEEHREGDKLSEHRFRIVGTGHTVPAGYTHRGLVQQGSFVWHLYQAPVS